jgi:cell division transport system permease protein
MLKFFGRIGYYLREGLSNLFINGFMSFASVFVIAACLLITGSFSLLAFNIENIIQDLSKQTKIVAFVDEKYGDEDARAIESRIEKLDNVAEAEFVSRGDAMDGYLEQFDDNKLFDELNPQVFRDRYYIDLTDLALTAETEDELIDIPGIVKVNAYIEISRGFVTLRNIVTMVSGALIVVLLIVSIFMMSNTLKLSTFTRREEIAIMRMVGGTSTFIQMPFVVEGLLLGLLGAAIGYLLQWGIYRLALERLNGTSVVSFVRLLDFSVIALPLVIAFGAIGLIIGVLGSVFSIRNYLKV